MAKRAGRTVKLSVSLDREDVSFLEKRAKRITGGNVSAALAEMIRLAQEWEGREELARWLGEGRPEPTEAEMNAIRDEWRGRKKRSRAQKRKRKRAA